MIFTENKIKAFLYKLIHPNYRQIEKWEKITLFMVLITILNSLIYPGAVSLSFFATVICFLILVCLINSLEDYNRTLEIKSDCIISSFDHGRGRKKIHVEQAVSIQLLNGIEYFTKTNEIAFLAPITYENGVTDFGMRAVNVYTEDVIAYLNKNVMKVKRVRKGSFSDKWRN